MADDEEGRKGDQEGRDTEAVASPAEAASPSSLRYIESVHRSVIRQNDKFRVRIVTYRIGLKGTMIEKGSEDVSVILGIDRLLGGLRETVTEIQRRERLSSRDHVSIEISGGDLNQPVTFPFRLYHSPDRQTRIIMDTISQVKQSKKEWLLGRRLDVTVTVVSDVSANGKRTLRRLTEERVATNLESGVFWRASYEGNPSESQDVVHILTRCHRLHTSEFDFTPTNIVERFGISPQWSWEQIMEAWTGVPEWEHPIIVLEEGVGGLQNEDDSVVWTSGEASSDVWVLFRFQGRIYHVTATHRIYRDTKVRFCHLCGMSCYNTTPHQCVTIGGVRRYRPQTRRPHFRYRKEEKIIRKRSLMRDHESLNCMGRALLRGLQHSQLEVETVDLYSWYQKLGITNMWGVPCGFLELTHIQAIFNRIYTPSVQILVYDESNQRITFVGKTRADTPKQLYLNLYEDHFEFITSMPGWLGKSYFCTICHTGYSDKSKHRCTRSCLRCKNNRGIDHYIPMSLQRVRCEDCQRDFWNEACWAEHKRMMLHHNSLHYSTCQRWHRCLQCRQTVDLLQPKTMEGGTLVPMSHHHPRCDIHDCPVCKTKAVHSPTHQCFVQPLDRPGEDEEMPFHLCFFDFEARCLDEYHVVNKVVAVLVCHRCAHTLNQLRNRGCTFCGRQRVHVFETVDAFGRWIMGPQHEVLRLYTFLAHNFKGYDSYPLLEWLIRERYQPRCVFQGAKVMMMSVEGVTFKDSFNYITTGLRKFPSTFDFEEAKGYFPHFFNRQENEGYVGPYPPLEDYGIEDMEDRERTALTTWWEEERRHTGDVFDFQKQLFEYCLQDVVVLAHGCLKFRELFVDSFRVDPFKEAVTIAGTCLTVLRKNFLQEKTLGVVPPLGYRHRDIQSVEAMEWLWSLRRGPAFRWKGHPEGEETILGAKVDGYDPESRSVYQYHGCVFHGCQRCFQQNRQRVYFPAGRSMEDLYDKTADRTWTLRQAGYRVVEKWGHDWDVEREQHRPFPDWLADQSPIMPREALMGGRTNAITLYAACHGQGSSHVEGWEPVDRIRYIDVVSLYPSVMDKEEFPLGHPECCFGEGLPSLAECATRLISKEWFGLVRCEVDPPRGLYFPVLPKIVGHKLLFTLCTTCAESESVGSCPHETPQRRLKGIWTSPELRVALTRGYRLHKVHEAWLYAERSNTLFHDYVRENMKLKLEASGWPEQCTTEEARRAFLYEVEEHQGIRLDPEKVKKNPGLRAVAKACLNSGWGKLSQNPFRAKTEYVSSQARLFELLHDDTLSVVKIMVLTDDMLQVRYEVFREAVDVNPNGNVVVGAFVTAHARLRLYSQLECLGERVLYHDTDSIIYTTQGDQPEVEIGNRLGQWADECGNPEEDWLVEFVALGPKTYAYRTHRGECVVKCKGFSLTPAVRDRVDLGGLLDLLTEREDEIAVCYPRKIVREPESKRLKTMSQTKHLRVVYTKRARQADGIKTLPYGY